MQKQKGGEIFKLNGWVILRCKTRKKKTSGLGPRCTTPKANCGGLELEQACIAVTRFWCRTSHLGEHAEGYPSHAVIYVRSVPSK